MMIERRGIYWVRPAKVRVAAGVLQAYKIVNAADFPDSIGCHTWDGTDEGDEMIHVAKPWWLRRTPFHGLTVDGIAYSYFGNLKRDETPDGEATFRTSIQKPYVAGNIIWATHDPSGVSGVSVDDEAVMWIDDNRTARDWLPSVATTSIVQMKIQTNGVKDNHIVCRTWDADADPPEGTTDILVAKPWLIRVVNWEGITRLGIKYSKVFEYHRTAELLTTGQKRDEFVEERYLDGDIIKVGTPIDGDVALTVAGTILTKEDLNTDGRQFIQDSDFKRPGILWICGGVNTAARIVVVNPDNFCPECEMKSPGPSPSGMGGDHDVMWHCDKSLDMLYKFNTTTLEIISEDDSPDLTPNGIGGTVDNVWHCDITSGLVYRLFPVDFTVDYDADLDVPTPSGIGGDDGVVWFCHSAGDNSELLKLLGTSFAVLSRKGTGSLPYLGTPNGIGGDADGVWYCDADDNALYELLTDFTKVRKRIGPVDPISGIGGKLS